MAKQSAGIIKLRKTSRTVSDDTTRTVRDTTHGIGQDATHGSGHTAIAVDTAGKRRNLTRLRRIEGQVRGLQRMIEEDRYCADVLVQISSATEALRAVARELMRSHLKHCATHAIRAGADEADVMYDELLELMFKHNR